MLDFQHGPLSWQRVYNPLSGTPIPSQLSLLQRKQSSFMLHYALYSDYYIVRRAIWGKYEWSLFLFFQFFHAEKCCAVPSFVPLHYIFPCISSQQSLALFFKNPNKILTQHFQGSFLDTLSYEFLLNNLNLQAWQFWNKTISDNHLQKDN